MKVTWAIYTVAAVLSALGPSCIAAAKSDSTENNNKKRRLRRVLKIGTIDETDRKKQQEDAMNSIDDIMNRSNDDANEQELRQLLLADPISNLNHKEIRVAREENVFSYHRDRTPLYYSTQEMARIIDRTADNEYYFSMSPEPTNPPTYRPTKRPTDAPYSDPTYNPTYNPTYKPTNRPTVTQGTSPPTRSPTYPPTRSPVEAPVVPATRPPTPFPTAPFPTRNPTPFPTQPAPVPVQPTPPPTNAPTNTPTPNLVCGALTPQVRETLIGGQISTYSGSDASISGTPQNQAFRWLIDDDELQVCPEDFLNVQQRYILAVLYFSTGGDQWTNCNALSSPNLGPCARGDEARFLSSSDVCFWYGISCNRLRVSGISIDENNLNGILPDELGFMEQIEDLDFDGELEEGLNFVIGSIPTTFGLLEKLVTLDLDSNQLTGSIPEEIFDASRLTIMDLDSNELTGTLSAGFGNFEELQILFLDNNGFFGTLASEMGAMERLRFLRLDRNELSGTIPQEWQAMDSLRVMFLNNNGGITGTIPEYLGNFVEMQQLSLFDTGISGTVPSTIGQLTGLVNLFLHFTDLTGTMPQEICDLRTSGALNFLTADCAGDNPKLQCSQPDCCTVCF